VFGRANRESAGRSGHRTRGKGAPRGLAFLTGYEAITDMFGRSLALVCQGGNREVDRSLTKRNGVSMQ
jgi:hypothetical protein